MSTIKRNPKTVILVIAGILIACGTYLKSDLEMQAHKAIIKRAQ